ncbi:MAG: hypothetical protein GY796_03210 [Chloroflexi bacterium]|nr:hypothetical protein [Chloroflexota bacterium]
MSDAAVDQKILERIQAGDLRYILIQRIGRGNQQEIGEWMRGNCTAVTGFDLENMPGDNGRDNNGDLYFCE